MVCPSAGSRDEANDRAEGDDARRAAENQSQDTRCRGAQGDANAELARALLDGIA